MQVTHVPLPTVERVWVHVVALQVGMVSAGADKNESARNRRKRQAQEQSTAGVATATSAAEQKANWASPKNQRRAFG